MKYLTQVLAGLTAVLLVLIFFIVCGLFLYGLTQLFGMSMGLLVSIPLVIILAAIGKRVDKELAKDKGL